MTLLNLPRLPFEAIADSMLVRVHQTRTACAMASMAERAWFRLRGSTSGFPDFISFRLAPKIL